MGLEFAQAYRRFGSHVTVVEHGPQLLAREDSDVAEAIREVFSAEEIEVIVGADVLRVHRFLLLLKLRTIPARTCQILDPDD